MADDAALRKRRQRAHAMNDHRLCLPARCEDAPRKAAPSRVTPPVTEPGDVSGLPEPPDPLAADGWRLWEAVHRRYVLDPAETELLFEACRVLDQLWRLDKLIMDRAGSWLTPDGRASHPLLREQREQRKVLAMLVAALRLPDVGDTSVPLPASVAVLPRRDRRGEG